MRVTLPLLPKPLRWAAVVAVAAVIFYLSVLTEPPAVTVAESDDVFVVLEDSAGFAQAQWRHFLAYGTLAGTLAYATADWEWSRWQGALAVILVAAIFGLTLELWQAFTPRHFDVRDIAANTLGACLVFPWYLVRPRVTLWPVSAPFDSGRDEG